MRWGSTGNNVGVGATLNDNTSFYYYHEPVGPLGLSHGQPRGIVQAKNPPDKRLGRSTGRSFNTLKRTPNPEVEPESTEHSPLIMCAGRRFYGSNSEEDRDNNHPENFSRTSSNGGDTKPPPNNQPEPFAVMTNTDSSLRHHTDEELEQIIRDLRGQVFQKQGQQSTNNESETTQAQKHSRKHLKNPVEKMETAKVPVSASIGSTSHELLHRQLSSCQLNRLVAETTIQMVVPAVLTASPSTARIAGRTASSPQVSSLDLSSLRRSRPNSGSVNPRSKSATTTRLRQKKKVEQDDSSDCDEGYLYLVGESEGESEALSLSPVGPWVVDSFTIETPRSPSASTCYSVSSLESEGLDVGGACTTTDLATMSPRSRLLYFSACADDSEILRTQPHGVVLRRCGSALTSRALEARNAKPKRCSSATVSTRIRTTSASRLKTRRRKQSGSTTSSRSSNSDTLATQR